MTVILFQIFQKVCVNKTNDHDDTIKAITIIMKHVYKQHKRCGNGNEIVELVRNFFLWEI